MYSHTIRQTKRNPMAMTKACCIWSLEVQMAVTVFCGLYKSPEIPTESRKQASPPTIEMTSKPESCRSTWKDIKMSINTMVMQDTIKYTISPITILTLTQTCPCFYVSAVQVS